MKKLLPLLAALALLSACGETNNGTPLKTEKRLPLVEIATVEYQQEGQTITRTGTLRADRQVKLINEEEGRIASLPVHEGDRVAEGDLLLQLNDKQLKAELKKARAQREQAALDVRRLQRLQSSNVVSEDELARARTALDVARAEEDLLRIRLDNTRITAPFAGVVSARLAEPGDAVARFTHLLTLTDDKTLLAALPVSELVLPSLAQGDPVTLSLDALGDTRLKGRILRIHPTVDPVTRQGTIEVVLEDPPPQARPGQLCRVELQLRPQPRLTVPFPALRRDTQGEYVFLYGEDKAVHYTPVVSGLHLGERIEIVTGMSQGKQVVVNGFLGLNDGMKVSLASRSRPTEVPAQQ
jgi:RND family efflux transporter MFP subunit